MEAHYLVILVSALLILLAAFSSLLAFRFGAPLLLLFLMIGLAAGEDGLGIHFDNFTFAYQLGSLALAVVLFDSGFGTSLHAFRLSALPAIVLASAGVLITAALFALAAHLLLDFSLLEGLLLGSIVASTDAAAVFFLLRIGGISIRERVLSALEVESGTNDPMAIFLTIALAGGLAAASGLDGHGSALDLSLILLFFQQMVLGFVFGMIGGALIVFSVNRFAVDRGIAPVFVLALAIAIFSFTGLWGGSGFLAVYVAGIYAGNRKIAAEGSIRRFQDGMTWLAQIIMFLVLGLLASPSQFPAIILPALGLALFLIFFARPLAVWLCLIPFDFTEREKAFIAWVGLRGAVSILLAITPVLEGLENGHIFFNTAFIIVLVSLLVQGWTIKPVAKKLGIIVPQRQGAIDKVELDLPGAAHHELLSYRVVKDSPVLSGERLPRWARPSLVIRDGRSMRYQYAGRLRENDYVYLFVAPAQVKLLDRLFASRAPVAEDDAEFFGAFAISPYRPARELDAAYGPGLLTEAEKELTVGELIALRLGGQAGYADRLRLGQIILIVRDTDEKGDISSVGISLEAIEPATEIPYVTLARDAVASVGRLLAGLAGRFRRTP